MSLRKNERNLSVDSFITNVCINPTFMLSLVIDGQLFSLHICSFKPNMTALHVGQRNQDWLERFPDQSQRVMSELKDSSINLKAFSQKFCSLIGFANPSLFNNIWATDRTFYRCTGIVTYLSCWENTTKVCKSLAPGSLLINFSRVLLTSQVGFHAGKPIKIAVYCFYSIT